MKSYGVRTEKQTEPDAKISSGMTKLQSNDWSGYHFSLNYKYLDTNLMDQIMNKIMQQLSVVFVV